MARTKAFNQEEVLEKALQLFWRQGYDATSMEDLVQHLGISRSSIYDTFGDKRQLFLQALARYRAQTSGAVIRQLDTHPQPKLFLQQMLESAVHQACQDRDRKGCFLANSTVELANYDAEVAEIAQENREQFVGALARAIQRAQNSGEMAPTFKAAQLAETIFVVYNGLQVVSKVDGDRTQLQSALQPILTLLA